MTTQTAVILAIILMVYSSWVSFLVIRRKDIETIQKSLQVALVWLVPLIGAVLIHLVTQAQKERLSGSISSGVEPQMDQGVSPRDFNSPGHD
jgi:ABC-type Na+ efflux pump permease subunit